jgi:hypothetical protein
MLQRLMQLAQHGIAVDPGEPAAFVDDFAGHHDEVDSLALRRLDDSVENPVSGSRQGQASLSQSISRGSAEQLFA